MFRDALEGRKEGRKEEKVLLLQITHNTVRELGSLFQDPYPDMPGVLDAMTQAPVPRPETHGLTKEQEI